MAFFYDLFSNFTRIRYYSLKLFDLPKFLCNFDFRTLIQFIYYFRRLILYLYLQNFLVNILYFEEKFLTFKSPPEDCLNIRSLFVNFYLKIFFLFRDFR